MQGIENKELNERVVKLWLSGRYKSYSAIARLCRTYPKLVSRAVNAHKEMAGSGRRGKPSAGGTGCQARESSPAEVKVE